MKPKTASSLALLALCLAPGFASADDSAPTTGTHISREYLRRQEALAHQKIAGAAAPGAGNANRLARAPADNSGGSLVGSLLHSAQFVGCWAGIWLVFAFIAVVRFGARRRVFLKWPVVAAFSLLPIVFLEAVGPLMDQVGIRVTGPLALFIILALVLATAFAVSRYWDHRFPPPTFQTHGSARWATSRDAARLGRVQKKGYVLADSHGFVLGRLPKPPFGRDPRFRYTGHVLTCAPTGAGKGIGAVIPNLLEYPGSALVLDLKGENFAVTARARERMGHGVFLVDPFGVAGGTPNRCNWLDRLNPSDPDVVSESAMLADMLIVPDSAENSYWDDSARDLLRGLLIHVASFNGERRHMGEVRRLLTGGEAVLNEVLVQMAASSQAFGVPARAANAFTAKADRDRSGVLSTAIRHTSFLDDPRVVAALSTSDFRLDDLKRKPMTVYLALPPGKLAAYSRLMRGFVGLTLAGITATKEQPRFKVALFLDEFPQLGRMAAIEESIALVRGYGAVFWIFVQDLSQLKAVYPKWQTFLANSAKQFFSTSDFDTARYISQSLGEATIEFHTSGSNQQNGTLIGGGSGGSNQTQHLTARALLTPDEVMRLGPVPIVLINGEPPYLLRRLNYLEDPEYRGLAAPNPFHAAA